MRHCTNDDWGFSTTSGGSIGGYEISVYRFFNGLRTMLKGQLYGKIVASSDEATRLGLEYGYLQPYGRNTYKFVMSRAARKRGITTTDGMYNSAAARKGK